MADSSGATEESQRFNGSQFPKLSSDHDELDTEYDVIVIGSGYGASIAASRCARSGQKVCVLERGKEWLPGSFPESMSDAKDKFQIDLCGKPDIIGDPTDLYEFVVSKDITVVQGCGLGGGSLINANVALDADKRVFESSVWPTEIQKDMDVIMNVDRKKYQEMMQWMEYPDNFPKLKKMEAMKKCATAFTDLEDIEDIFKKTPLYVNFEKKKPGDNRFDQPACNACGNCVSGCNTGAKNTLNMNYLPDAKVHGAKIFTEIIVDSVEKPASSKLWKVYYKRYSGGKKVNDREECLLANVVILGAGSLGSTKILLKSKQRKRIEISETIGSRFTGNGDSLGFSYLGDDVINGFGLESGKYEDIKEKSPGPCITSVIDLRSLPNMPYNKGMVIEDGSPPGVLANSNFLWLYMAASQMMGIRTFSCLNPSSLYRKLKDLLTGKEMEKMHTLLVMSHDNASGRIKLDENDDGNEAYIHWEDVGEQKNFEMVDEHLLKCAKKLGGYYIKNPLWSNGLFDKRLVTVHPLGGCPMAENGNKGVVNHKGQVFSGKDENVHEGLYVMDGSIIPCSVGVNPTMSIGILSERCCRLLIQDQGWTFDESVKDFKTLCP